MTEELLEDPSWEDVEQRLARLNEREFNDLYLDRPTDRRWLCVGGGGGRYLVMLTCEATTADEFWLLVTREDEPDGMDELVTGGQLGRFAARHIVPMSHAVAAARAFYESGEPAPDLTWERDP
jgi:hypothetical protein